MNNDLMQDVTDKIVSQLEIGVAPWVKPWTSSSGGMPSNFTTNKAYRGINTLILWAAGSSYSSDKWLTYKQAQAIGAQVKKGEKGTQIAVYKKWELKDKVNPEGESRFIPILKAFTVFNVEQCDGIELPTVNAIPDPLRHEQAEKLLQQAVITTGGERAFYSPSFDKITLPAIGAFNSADSYYSTALHELTHWTGNKARLDRDFTGKFGTEAYAREELVAELGSAYVCSLLGIAGKLQHAEYIGSWLEVLKHDKKAIFNAASHAQKAVDFINKSNMEVEEQEELAA